MPDFAHYCVTASSHIATDLGLCGASETALTGSAPFLVSAAQGAANAREDLCGWLGDAAITGMSAVISFKWDDYWSDADAVATHQLMPLEGGDFRKAANRHYSNGGASVLASSFGRCPVYLSSVGIERCRREISWMLADGTEEALEELLAQGGYPDTKRFLDRLAQGDDGPVGGVGYPPKQYHSDGVDLY